MLVKILGAIDLLASAIFLMIIFNISPIIQLTLFCAGLLLLKGLFILQGDVLSVIDLLASITLIISIFFQPIIFIAWIFAFFLLSKGIVSFI